jgi:acetyl esterase
MTAAHQVLFYPVTDANFDTESYYQSPRATSSAGTQCSGSGTYTRPTHSSGQRVPAPGEPRAVWLATPALVIAAEADVLRDEGEAYANDFTAFRVFAQFR